MTTVNREWAETQVKFCEEGIADSIERYSKGLTPKSACNLDVDRLTLQMSMPKLLLDVENGVRIR